MTSNLSDEIMELLAAVACLREDSIWVSSTDLAQWNGWTVAETESLARDAVGMGYLTTPKGIVGVRFVNLTQKGVDAL